MHMLIPFVCLQGKTSVINALMSKDNKSAKIHEDARTVGIDIKKWKPYPNNPASLSFSVLDLAGQAVYALTHQVHFVFYPSYKFE
jgi:GTPase SAR1 family protein